MAKKARHKSGVVAEGDKSEYARAADNHNLSLHKTSCDLTTSPVSQSRVLRKKIVNRQAKEVVSESKACLVLETRTRKDTQMHMCTHTHTRFKGHLLHMHMISASLCGHAGAAVLVGFRQACRRGRWEASTRQAACTPEVWRNEMANSAPSVIVLRRGCVYAFIEQIPRQCRPWVAVDGHVK